MTTFSDLVNNISHNDNHVLPLVQNEEEQESDIRVTYMVIMQFLYIRTYKQYIHIYTLITHAYTYTCTH